MRKNLHYWRFAADNERGEFKGLVVRICKRCGLKHVKPSGASYLHIWILPNSERVQTRGVVPIKCKEIADECVDYQI